MEKLRFSVTCTQCGKQSIVKVSAPGDIRCECPRCGQVFPVHISRASFAVLMEEQRPTAERRAEAERRASNRQLALFFAGVALFVALAIGGLWLAALIMR